MKPIYFIADGGTTGACKTRGIEICEHLKSININCTYDHFNNISSVKNSIIIYIKRLWDVGSIERLKTQNNIIIADTCCGEVHPLDDIYFRLCNGIMFPNKYTLEYYKNTNTKNEIIYHHIDPKFKPNNTMDEMLRICYIGSPDTLTYNIPEQDTCSSINTIFNFSKKYNCHYCVWKDNTPEFYFRPNSKLSTAVGCNANIILSRSPTHLDLLDSSYPYYTNANSKDIEQTISFVKETFNKSEWKIGKDMINLLKERISLKNIANDYIKYLEGF